MSAVADQPTKDPHIARARQEILQALRTKGAAMYVTTGGKRLEASKSPAAAMLMRSVAVSGTHTFAAQSLISLGACIALGQSDEQVAAAARLLFGAAVSDAARVNTECVDLDCAGPLLFEDGP